MSLRHIETGKTLEREMVERDGRLSSYSFGETFCGRWFWYGQRRSWAFPPGAPLRDETRATCRRCVQRYGEDADKAGEEHEAEMARAVLAAMAVEPSP